MMLGDLGANVIKVERPAGGDETRGWGPPFDPRGESAYFLSVNRNKRSLTADLDSADDRALILELARSADVVLENFLPGVLARKGVDPASMLSEKERLIWCTIRGYADDPARPGYDFAVQAEAGWMSVTGEPGGVPVKMAVALVDVLAGKDAAIAILGALVGGRERRAADRHLVVTLFGSAVAGLVNVAQNAMVTGGDARRWGNTHANLVPYQLFDTADAPLVVAVGSDAQWLAFTRVLGQEDLFADEALRTNAGRVENRARCVEAIQHVMLTDVAANWKRRCQSVGVPVGEVRSVLQALSASGASALTGVPSSVGGIVHRPPPLLGEHSDEIRRGGWG